MGELKKQTVDTKADGSVIGSVKQLNERMREFLYEPNNMFLSSYLERFELSTGMKREQVGIWVKFF